MELPTFDSTIDPLTVTFGSTPQAQVIQPQTSTASQSGGFGGFLSDVGNILLNTAKTGVGILAAQQLAEAQQTNTNKATSNATVQQSPNYMPWIIGGGIALAVVVLVIAAKD